MSIKKMSLPKFWLPFMVLSLIPAIGYGNGPALGANDSSSPQSSEQPKVKPATPDDSDAFQDEHLMSKQEALSVFTDLQIVTLPRGTKGDGSTDSTPTSAVIEALVPTDCLPLFEIWTSDAKPEMTSGNSSNIGFTIDALGGKNVQGDTLDKCMHKNNCNNGKVSCTSLSDLVTPIKIDSTSAVTVDYLNGKKKAKLEDGAWTPGSLRGSMLILSQGEIKEQKDAADAKQKDDQQVGYLKDGLICARTEEGMPMAQQDLDNLTDPSKKGTLANAIAKSEKGFQSAHLNAYFKAVDAAIKKGGPFIDQSGQLIDKFKDLENAAYSLDAEYGGSPGVSDALAERIRALSQAVIADGDADEVSSKIGLAMLARAEGDGGDDSSSGFQQLSDKVTAEMDHSINFDIPAAQIGNKLDACLETQGDMTEAQGQMANAQRSGMAAMQDAQQNLVSVFNNQKAVCADYSKSMTKLQSSLTTQAKADRCTMSSTASAKARPESQNPECKQINEEEKILAQIPNAEKKKYDDEQKAAAADQRALANLLQSPQQQQQPQQQPMMNPQQQAAGAKTVNWGGVSPNWGAPVNGNFSPNGQNGYLMGAGYSPPNFNYAYTGTRFN